MINLNLSKRTILLISCLTGLLAGQVYLGRLAAHRQDMEQLRETREILVAATNISVGDRFNRENITVSTVPESPAATRSIQPIDMAVISGQRALHQIPAGSQIHWSDLPQTPRFIYPTEAIPPAQRAVSLPADEVLTMTHLVNPGDLVDVVWTGYLADSSVPSTRIISSGVEVLAVGRDMQVRIPDENGQIIPLSVTILMDQQASLELLKYRAMGEISFLVQGRNIFDRSSELVGTGANDVP
jgi:pilus assembly protein CpaB